MQAQRYTYNGNFAAKVILDLACLDRIGGIFGDNLVQVYLSSARFQRFA